ncbi:MAG TPA: GNAT family N-acetyltransferase [Propionibacteriaceae bacterium]|nr:GNAT family N-acetyltransferase [Propionibacteriaceae bacterium]
MDGNTRSIIELAWARMLNLPDDALMTPSEGRLTATDDTKIIFVRLWEHRVLVAPESVLKRAEAMTDDALADGSSLLALSQDPMTGVCSGRLLASRTLAFTDSYVKDARLESVLVLEDEAAVADLERLCPPDDIAEVALSRKCWKVAILDDTDQITAGAGFDEREHILAHLGVLTPPRLRRNGFGTLAAGVATNEALDQGLVPQWSARVDNVASQAIAARLGYLRVGSQTTVLLSS